MKQNDRQDDEEQAEDPGVNREMVSRDSAEKVQDFRAQLLRNMLGGADPDLAAPNPVSWALLAATTKCRHRRSQTSRPSRDAFQEACFLLPR